MPEKRPWKPWTRKSEELLRKNYGKVSSEEMQQILMKKEGFQRSIEAIRNHANVKNYGGHWKPWSEKSDEILRKNYKKVSLNEIQQILVEAGEPPRSKNAIQQHAGIKGYRDPLSSLPLRNILKDQEKLKKKHLNSKKYR